MKHLILFLCLIGTFSGLSQTTIRVVNGQNLQTIIDNANAGSNIIVEGGNFGNITISKQLFLFGTGYFHDATQITPGVSTLGIVFFNVGSDGSMFSGFQCSDIHLKASNILISRNYANYIRLGYSGTSWDGTANGIIVKQNYFTRFEAIGSTNNNVNFFSLKNNIIKSGFQIQGNISGEIKNNTFNADNDGENGWWNGTGVIYGSFISPDPNNQTCGILPVIVKNNILTYFFGNNQGQNCGYGGCGNPSIVCGIGSNIPSYFLGNVIHLSGFSFPNNQSPGNSLISDINILYNGYPTNPNNLALDARNQLAPNSPAKGAGEGGTDAGAFGGDEPYVLSGIPSIPSIYQLTVPSQVQQGGTLNVQIKAKVNN